MVFLGQNYTLFLFICFISINYSCLGINIKIDFYNSFTMIYVYFLDIINHIDFIYMFDFICSV